MISIEKIASSVEQAIEDGLAELKLERNMVDVEIIEEGGFLRKSIVKLTTKPSFDEKAFIFINNLIGMAGLDCSAELCSDDAGCKINLSGTDSSRIAGYKGETLDAIQYLTTIVALKNDKESTRKVIVDADGFREKRIAIIKLLAEKLAEKAKLKERPVKFDPMNPYERRAVHSALSEIEGVSSTSEGTEPFRFVVVIPDGFDYVPGKLTYSPPTKKPFGSFNGGQGNRPQGNRNGNFNGGYNKYKNNSFDKDRGYSDKENSPMGEASAPALDGNRFDGQSYDSVYGTSNSFKRNGFGKTRSFGQKDR